MKRLIYYLVILLSVVTAEAQTKDSPLSLKRSIGMEGGTVFAVDKKGSELLIGSSTGIFWSTNFGIEWNVIEQSIIHFPSTQVRILAEGNYIFTRYSSVYTYNRFTKEFTTLPEIDSFVDMSGPITALFTSQNKILVGTGAGYIAEFNPSQSKWDILLDSSESNTRIVKGIVHSNTLYYAAVGKEIMKSADGKTWSNTQFSTNTHNDSFINSITVFENTPVVSTVDDVFRSTNNGDTWFSVKGDISESDIVMDLQSNGNELVAVLLFGQIMRFKKSETKWELVDFPERFGYVNTVYYDNDGMYVGVEDQGIYHSANGRNGFATMNKGFGEVSVNSFVNFGNTLYAATSNGIYASANKGVTWYIAGKQGTRIHDVAVHKGTLLTAGADGIYRYDPQTGGWISSGLQSKWCNSFFEINDKLLVTTGHHTGFQQAYIYESTDGGAGWNDITNGDLKEESVSSIRRLDTNSTTIFAATDVGLYKRALNGGEWSKVPVGNFLLQINDFAVHKKTIVVAMAQNVIIASTDDGVSWIAYSSGMPIGMGIGNINGVKEIDGVLYALTDVGIFTRKENDEDWAKVNDSFGAITISKIGENTLVGSKHGALYQDKSTTGISDYDSENTLLVYPNPANTLITVQSNEVGRTPEFYITDLVGKTLIVSSTTENKQNNTSFYDISSLPNGNYILRSGNKSKLLSVVK